MKSEKKHYIKFEVNEVDLIVENGNWDKSICTKESFINQVKTLCTELIKTDRYTYYFLDETIYRVLNKVE